MLPSCSVYRTELRPIIAGLFFFSDGSLSQSFLEDGEWVAGKLFIPAVASTEPRVTAGNNVKTRSTLRRTTTSNRCGKGIKAEGTRERRWMIII